MPLRKNANVRSLSMRKLMTDDDAEWQRAGEYQRLIDDGLLVLDGYGDGVISYREADDLEGQ